MKKKLYTELEAELAEATLKLLDLESIAAEQRCTIEIMRIRQNVMASHVEELEVEYRMEVIRNSEDSE